MLDTNLSEEEKQQVNDALNAEAEADRAEQMAAILAVTGEMNVNNTRDGERRIVGDLAESNSLSDEQKNELIEKLLEQQKNADEQQTSKREYADAALRAKLEARKKLREEKAKEDAMRKEMDLLSEKRVCLYSLL